MRNITKLTISLATAITLVFTGCGTSSDDNTQDNKILQGVFIDSPVEGITYKTATQSGLTDINGSFKYIKGEKVTFSLGGITLGETKASDILTPQGLAGVTEVKNSKAQDMLILLQTLDSDHNAANGIEINKATRNLSNSMDVNFIEDNIDVNSTIKQFGIDDSDIVSDTEAIVHFQKTLKAMYPSRGLKFTYDMLNNKSFYKIFVKEDKVTTIYVKLTFRNKKATFEFGTKDDWLNNSNIGKDEGTSEVTINNTGILTFPGSDDKWELLKIENDKVIILNTSHKDDSGNERAKSVEVEKWITQKPVGFP